MNRRKCLAGLGAGASVLVVGCSGLLSDSDTPDHFVQIANGRETDQEVVVETEFEGEETEYGPQTIEPSDKWEVSRFRSHGELTVRVYVNAELVWDDTHEIPTPGGDRRSFAQVELLPDDKVRARVKQED